MALHMKVPPSRQEQAKCENDRSTARGVKAINFHIEAGYHVSPFDAAKSAIGDILHAYCSGVAEDLDELLEAAKRDYLQEFATEFLDEVRR